MSLLSRFFRKPVSQSTRPASASQPAASKAGDKSPHKPGTADRALAAFAEEKALRSAIDAQDVQAVARLVVAGTSTQIRQAAAAAIEDPDVLRQLIRDVRGGNDKHVYKILTSRRDGLLEQARKQVQVQAEIQAVSEALERHSRRAYDVLSSPKLSEFESRWAAVAAQADPELHGNVQQWIDRSREIIAEPLRWAAAKAALEQAAADAAAEARRLREQEAQAAATAAAEQVVAIEDQNPALDQDPQAQLQPDQQAVKQIGELIRKARAALSDGNTSRAAGVHRTIQEKLAEAAPLPANLASQIQQLDAQLKELKDWKSFSVAPKRAELIEEMESLIGITSDPQALADQIKSLKEERRTLGKGAGENADADSQRFHDAAQKAYQPCSEYFAAQALIRQENLQRRDALLAKLTAFEAGHNWEQADWQAVIKILRDTKQAWYGHSPVDRVAGKQQQESFTALSASLQGRMDAVYASNRKQKESLIERAQQLMANEDGRKAIDAVKALQQTWRTLKGPLPRTVDQSLWEEFRRHCDAVFQKREQDAAAYTAGLERNKTQALALCEQIEDIAALEGNELLERAGARVELRKAFEALGEFPRADTRELHNRLDRALDRCEKALARQRARDAERSWSAVFEAAKHVRAYRLALVRGADADQLTTLKETAEHYFASVQRWPKNGLETLSLGLKQGLEGEPSSDLVANERALRMLCIRAEIQSDTPTPPEDQALRREYQLQRLVNSMGQGLKSDDAQWDKITLEWVSAGPVDDAVYERLVQRFRHCRERGSLKAL
ncbi:MAG: DUF349 domain-containing protein [Panacagrimonas sp.]